MSTSNFGGTILTSAESTVQLALDRLDDVAGTGGGTWGSITGTLSDQTDLDTALGLKAPLDNPTFTGTVEAPDTRSIGLVMGAF